jgi:Mrp family chromosome partitioning ATPase
MLYYRVHSAESFRINIDGAMADLMNQLKKEYDYIILDTPPVGLVSDALELSSC